MTTYFTAVANELLPELRTGERLPAGFRLLREIGPAGSRYPGMTLVEFADDQAHPDLTGRVVTPTLVHVGDSEAAVLAGRYPDSGCSVFCDLAQGDPDEPVVIEWCRIDPLIEHTVHVSRHGYYRWDKTGLLVPTPHWADPAFGALYSRDPLGQTAWRAS